MPSFVHGKATRVYIDTWDASGMLTEAGFAGECSIADATTFGNSDRNYLVGLTDARQTYAGIWSGGTAEADAQLSALLGGTAKSITTEWKDGDTLANLGFAIRGDATGYAIISAVDDAVKFTAEVQSSVAIDRVQSLYAKGAIASAGTVPAADYGAAWTPGKAAWYLHVFTGTVSACTITIEHSATQGGAYVPVGTASFAGTVALPAPGGLYAGYGETAGTVATLNRWVRINPTVVTGGAIVAAASIARR